MVRWEPGAPERLQQAALALFAAQGYEQTTATEIAQAVGLTERTFFRHFPDKREALFHGQQRLVEAFLTGIRTAPAGAAPMEIVAEALRTAAEFFPDEHRPHSRTRQSVISQHPALQERETHKLAALAETVAAALRERGVDELTAALAARLGLTVFEVSFGQWIRDGEERTMAAIEEQVLGELRALGGS